MKQVLVFPAMLMALFLGSITSALGDNADLSGNWSMTVNGPTGPQTSEMSVTQDGQEISGTITGSQGAQVFKGTVAGTAVTFGFTMEAMGTPLDIAYAGEVKDQAMAGTVQFGSFGSGDFTAEKK